MKLTKKQQQFIKDAYNSNDVCSEWKTKIKDIFPKLFKETELEVGKWYKTSSGNLFNYMGRSGKHINPDLVYGFTNKSIDWVYEYDVTICNDKGLKPATKEEVEQALIAEAKKRGFKKGETVKYPCGNGSSVFLDGFKHEYREYSNTFYFYNLLVFEKGKWAEIIETITKEQAEKELGKKIVG